MLIYSLTLLCSFCILLAAFFAIRYRKVNAYLRMAALALAAIFVLVLYFKYDNTSQLYGLGILAVAFLFTLKWKKE
jgi:archaellum biogenesis protein FlaJ (TadC family)